MDVPRGTFAGSSSPCSSEACTPLSPDNLDLPLFPVMRLICWVLFLLVLPYLVTSTNQDVLVDVGLFETGGGALVPRNSYM